MKKNTLVVGFFALSLVLVACGKSESNSGGTPAPKVTAKESNAPAGPAIAPESDPRLPVPPELRKANPLLGGGPSLLDDGKSILESGPAPLVTPRKK